MSKELQERLSSAREALVARQQQVDPHRVAGPTLEEYMAYASLEIQLDQLTVATQCRNLLRLLAGVQP